MLGSLSQPRCFTSAWPRCPPRNGEQDRMMPVSFTNQLYGDEKRRTPRRAAGLRFVN